MKGKVLEVGSGHRPHHTADVLVDKFLDPVEREGPLTRDRPLVVGDGHQLPFQDKSFARVIARQVLEHADDPAQFVRELGRVAHEVVIETPSPLTEAMFRVRPFHRWSVARDAHGLVVWPIEMAQKSAYHGELFESLYEHNAFVYLLVRSRPDVFLTTWDGPAPAVRFGAKNELDDSIAALHARLCAGGRLRQLAAVSTAARSLATEKVVDRVRSRRHRH